MIKFITWQQYLISIGGLTLLYYLLILALYYRSEITSLFNSKPAVQRQPDEATAVHQSNFIGEPEFDGQQTVAAEELFFAAPDEEEEPEQAGRTEPLVKQPDTPIAPNETFLLGPVADFLKELKSGFTLLKEAQGDKEEFLTLLGILSEKYNQVMQSAYRPLMEVFILELAGEQLPFELALSDLQIINNN